MLTPSSPTWIVRGATFALWALAAGSAAYWGLKLSSAARAPAAPMAAPRQVAPADPEAIARLLGSSPAVAAAAPAVVALSSRFQLVGVAAGASSGAGAAVISVDGKPARPYRVGSTLDEGYVLQSVRGRQAVIASQRDGRPVLTLELPQQRFDAGRAPAVGASPLPGVPGAAGIVQAPPLPQSLPPALPQAPQARQAAPMSHLPQGQQPAFDPEGGVPQPANTAPR